MTSFTSVSPDWGDKPLYIVGGGPSLEGFDFNRIYGKGRILGVNDSAFNVQCDALFSLDQTWHRKRKAQIREFQGERWFAAPAGWDLNLESIQGVKYLVRRRTSGFTADSRDINGINSGYGALHLAYHKRARLIFLLGFDMKDQPGERISENKQKLKSHWYQPYEWHAKESHARFNKVAASFAETVSFFDSYNAVVVNANHDSLISAFPKCSLESL